MTKRARVGQSYGGDGRASAAPRVWLACSGVGSVSRGFESFSRECFEALKVREDLELTLVKGSGGRAPGERRVWTLRRHGTPARRLASLVGRTPYDIEQAIFAVGLTPLIRRLHPDVIFFSDRLLGVALMRWRALSRQKVRLLYSNGGPLAPPYPYADHVQQLTPGAYDYALNAGEPPERQTMLTLGLHMLPELTPLADADRASLRRKLELPAERDLLLSVAALNKWHKRLDYVISELARLPPRRRPYLVLLGQPEEETPDLLAQARGQLGSDGFTVRTVSLSEVRDFYRVADMFTLASTFEALGRAVLEALAEGLPVLAHDFHVTRFTLGEHGYVADLTRPGNLAELIASIGPGERSEDRRRARHRHVYENFSWEVLADRYAELLTRLAMEARAAPRRHEAMR